ncbi:putative glucosyltransferase [Phaeomoniella chlamydospora]|uniref:Alpha-1,3-glucosyltransferase n=1 Tax=Phaeomoniella chlamydospora TaxID=158046 RepID=A0A0G2E029_PHACM|nr:putative glucosyltransferase [Phaeomoniella chlamydospora]
MALYYSPVVFAYLLGACFSPSIRPGRLILIGAVTIISFVVLFAPLLLGAVYNDYRETPSINAKLPPPALLTEALRNLSVDIDSSSYAYTILLQASQSVYRIFPFARGLFEDKVANFWCVLNHAVIKLSALPTSIPLPRLSLYFTLIPISPASIILLINPRKSILLPALASCAWGFFLFSFQVHEKSVLLPLLPMTLLLFSNKGLSPSIRAWVGLANILGTWTLYPLLKRDDLRTPYAVITFLWSYLLGLPPTSISLYIPQTSAMTNEATTSDTPNLLTTLTHISLYAAMLFWHALETFLPPPQNKPDLWVVLNVIIGAAGFSLCYLWCTWKVVLGSGMLDNIIEKLEQRKAKNQKKTKQLQLQSQKQHQQQQQHSVRSSPSPQTNGNGTGKGGKKR